MVALVSTGGIVVVSHRFSSCIFEKCNLKQRYFICMQGDDIGLDFSRLLEQAQLSTMVTPNQQSSSDDDDDPNRDELLEVSSSGAAHTDILLVGNGGSLHAHRLMLSMRSPVLRDLIK